MDTPRFQRRAENFVCDHCGLAVEGGGFTNHCPKCLWSKHVDVNPGDRAALCGGMMEPIALEGSSPEYVIVHRCGRCGLEKRNKASTADDPRALVAVAERRQMRNNNG